jgi:hypothetical protein
VLPGSSGPPPGRRRVRGLALAGVAGVAAVAVAGTAWATMSFLSGGGAQPEDVLPADVFAVAKIDLDPAAGQKLAVYRLAKKFPATQDDVSDEKKIKDELLRSLFEDDDDVDYERDIAPWVGDRAAVAGVPGEGSEPEPLAAVAFTDRTKADEALRRLKESGSDGADDTGEGDEGEDDTFWAFSEKADYVLIGTSQATVDKAAKTDKVLGDVDGYKDAVDALDGDQIVTAWADLGAVWKALPEEERQEASDQGIELSGRVAIGGHATSDSIEVVGRTIDVRTGQKGTEGIGQKAGLDLVQGLPSDAVGAVGVTGLGDGMAAFYEQVKESGDTEDLEGMAEDAGLKLPDDLRVLFGEQTVAAVLGEEDFAARSRTQDPERAREVVDALAGFVLGGLFGGGFEEEYDDEFYEEGYGFEDEAAVPGTDPFGEDGMGDDGYAEEDYYTEEEFLQEEPLTDGSIGFRGQEPPEEQVRVLSDGLVVGSSAAAVDRMAQGNGGLGDSQLFRKAVPDARDAGFIFYVDIQRAIELAGGADAMSPEDFDNVKPLEAFGMSSKGSENGEFRLRLTVK